MNRSSVLCAILAATLCAQAHAQQTEELTYVAPLSGTTEVVTGPSQTPGIYNLATQPFSGDLTGSITITNGDLTSLVFTIDNYTFNLLGLGGFTTPLSPLPGYPDEWLFSPGGSLTVTGSGATLSFSLSPYHGSDVTVDVGPGGNTVEYLYGTTQGSCENGAMPPAGTPCELTASNFVPGTWKVSEAATPELDVTGAPGALLLLLGGIAVLRGRRRARGHGFAMNRPSHSVVTSRA